MKMTPNVKMLLIHKMSIDAIPPGGGMAAGIQFLSNKDSIMSGLRAANTWVEAAISAVRHAAEPNPWKDADDEAIAAEILRQVEAKMKKVQP